MICAPVGRISWSDEFVAFHVIRVWLTLTYRPPPGWGKNLVRPHARHRTTWNVATVSSIWTSASARFWFVRVRPSQSWQAVDADPILISLVREEPLRTLS
jgi:hypothetical protein